MKQIQSRELRWKRSIHQGQLMAWYSQHIPIDGGDVTFLKSRNPMYNAVEQAVVLAGFMIGAPEDPSNEKKES